MSPIELSWTAKKDLFKRIMMKLFFSLIKLIYTPFVVKYQLLQSQAHLLMQSSCQTDGRYTRLREPSLPSREKQNKDTVIIADIDSNPHQVSERGWSQDMGWTLCPPLPWPIILSEF